ncbi:MAG: hypothetical protein A2W99_08645 [Bacteroidetes bacterium GWF2_33_16]|nr:MAG: hypothetical protein A2X00_00510 [Bacteroidetes bacterium GWE2_32_14]OFY05568.1 MAG: hypothetical protein A2W99_08645 [Bacteroidetes bacterium GWF2_33_16]
MNNQDQLTKNNEPNNFIDMDALLLNLKNEDSRNLKLMKNFKWLYFGMIIFYTLLIIVNPDPELELHHRISGLCYVLSFVFFWLIFRKYHKEFGQIDYSQPSSEMLAKAADRYKMKVKNFLILIPSLVLMDIGLTISFTYRLTSLEMMHKILLIQAIFIPVMLISGFIGYLIWRKRQKPLRDGALQMLKDLKD